MMFTHVNEAVLKSLPNFALVLTVIDNVTIEISNFSLFQKYIEQVKKEITKTTTLKQLRNHQIVRAYREFYWHYLKIDPTKIRPSGEALARRLLRGRKFPKLVNLVDAYNLASARTFIAFGAYDYDKLHFPLFFKFAEMGTSFLGINMKEPKPLKGFELLIMDQEGIINVYPYRDAQRTRITGKTKKVLLITAGVPKLDKETLTKATQTALKYIKEFVARVQIQEPQIIYLKKKN